MPQLTQITPTRREGPFAFLRRNPDYRRYFIGMLPFQLAAQIEAVTIGWQVYEIARQTRSIEESAFLLGMVGLAQFLPLFLLTLLAGTLADRVSRKGIVIGALVAETVGVLGLMLIALDPAPQLWPIFGVAAVFGAARAFLSPAASALVPMLVDKADMPRAISASTMVWMGAVIMGPFLGGVLVAHSAALAYGVTAAAYVVGILATLRIQTPTTPERQEGHALALLREGLVYVWSNKIIFGAISLDLFAVLLGGATALLPVFARDILQVGPTGFGLLRAGPAIGGLGMAMWLTWRPIRKDAGVKMFLGVAAFGLATIVFGASQSLWLSVAALAVLGAGDMISVNVRQTLIQIVTPDHMRGRVSAVSGLMISGSNELGEFETGLVSRVIGPVMAAIFGGIGTLAVTGIWAAAFPDLRRANRLDGGDASASPLPAHPASAAASGP